MTGRRDTGFRVGRRLALAGACAALLLPAATGQSVEADVFFDQVGLDIDGEAAGDRSGQAVALSADGDRVAITASGYVRTVEWDGVDWLPVGQDIVAASPLRVALSANGRRLAVLMELPTRFGPIGASAQVFDWDGASWSQVGADIEGASLNGDLALSADGKRLAIPVTMRSVQIGNTLGARVLDWDGVRWSRAGADMSGDLLGGPDSALAMSADGARVAIGRGGGVRVFDWDGVDWSQVGADIERDLGSGIALSADGNRVAVGTRGSWDLGIAGGVRVLDLTDGNWVLVDESIGQPVRSVTLSADGRRLAYSATDYLDGEIGRTIVRDQADSGWADVVEISGDDLDDTEAGIALSAAGDRLAIGSPENYGTGPRSGHVRVFDLMSTSPAPPASPVALVPARLLETRIGNETVDGVAEGIGRRPAGSVTEVEVSGRGGVPDGVSAVMLNVAAVDAGGPGHVSVYPCGMHRPVASSLNHAAGQTIANSVFAPVGANGKVCIYTHATTDLIADVTGYLPGRSGLRSTVPARLLDSRTGRVDTGYEEWVEIDRMAAGSVTELWVTSRGGVPWGVSAVMLNVAVVLPDGPGHVTVYPCGTPRPVASSLNHAAGQTVANSVFTRVDAIGKVCIYTHATTDLIVDVTGYTPVQAGLWSLVPARVLETRFGNETVDGVAEGAGRRSAGSVTEVKVSGRGGVPDGVSAVVLNVAVVDAGGPGHVSVYPCGTARPVASSLNHVAGQTVANSVFTPVGDDGKVCIYSHAATDLIADVTGHT